MTVVTWRSAVVTRSSSLPSSAPRLSSSPRMTLRARARAYVRGSALNPDSDVLFASKAFPCTAVYRVLADEGLSCDVASGGELALALRGGFDPARIYLHGNAKSKCLSSSSHLRPGSDTSCSTTARHRTPRARQRRCARGDPGRADPHNPERGGRHPRGDLDLTADSSSALDSTTRPGAIDHLAASAHLRLVGQGGHIGSQLLDVEPFIHAVEALATLGDFDVYNLGGGLGVAYVETQEPPSIADYVATLASSVHGGARRRKAPPWWSRVAHLWPIPRSCCIRSRP